MRASSETRWLIAPRCWSAVGRWTRRGHAVHNDSYLRVVVCGLLGLLLVLGAFRTVHAGAYMFAGELNGVDIVTHPAGYTGTGGTLTVTVCIEPSSPNAADMEIPVQNIVSTFNNLIPTPGNLLFGGDNNIPVGEVDFESTALHEVGHCIGLRHPNLASESGLTGPDRNYTKTTDGADNSFDLDDGADDVIGSSDDLRGDDVNLHWFRNSNNNPFTIAGTVDSTTYSRDVGDLPGGHSFVANGDRGVATLLGVPNTEAVMQQGSFSDEDQRQLTHDDVATLLYAMSGLDEIASTADDYTLNLSYAGMTNSCDIVLDFDNAASFASCAVGGLFINSTHVRITSASISFNTGSSWFFNTETQPVISVTPSSRAFGNVNVGSSTDQTFTVQNTGGGTLSGNASTSAPFSIVSGGSYSLGAGASQIVTVRFSPASAGAFMGNVTFTGAGGATGTVTGTGVSSTFTLTVTKAGSGSGTVTSSPAGINCGSDCTESYNSSTSVTLTASPASGSTFAGWSGGGCSGTGTCTVTMNADTTITATFNLQTFTLTVSEAGSASGTVTSSPAGINCGGDCTENYSGTSVTLTASPAGGSTFAGWSGGGCSGMGTCTVTMNANTTITATYSKIFTDDPLTLQVTPVKVVHITELREAINTLRSNNGLGAFSFTDSTLTAGVTQVRAVHLTDLRTALNGVYDALVLTRPTYTDPTIVAGVTEIKAVHISEIRSAVRAVE